MVFNEKNGAKMDSLLQQVGDKLSMPTDNDQRGSI